MLGGGWTDSGWMDAKLDGIWAVAGLQLLDASLQRPALEQPQLLLAAHQQQVPGGQHAEGG